LVLFKKINLRVTIIGVCIKTANFIYYKNFPSRNEAESKLRQQNIENKLEIKNTIQDCSDYYKVCLFNGKNFLADKVDLHFIEAYIWHSSDHNYVSCKPNKRHIMFHNLILGHIPKINASVDHINQDPLDNRRSNLRITTHQIQSINQAPWNGTNQPGVYSNKKCWRANWIDKHGGKKNVHFSINKFGYEVAKQLAINKRLEIELSLNHYRIALHNLPPLEPQEPEADYDFREVENAAD